MSKIEESIKIMQDYIANIENVSLEATKLVDDKKKEKIRSISSKTIMTINSSISKLNNMIGKTTEDKQTVKFLDRLVGKCKDVTDYTLKKIKKIAPDSLKEEVKETKKEEIKKKEEETKETKKKRHFKLSELIKENEKYELPIDEDEEDEEKEEVKKDIKPVLSNSIFDDDESKYYFHAVNSTSEDNGDEDVLKVMIDSNENEENHKISDLIKTQDEIKEENIIHDIDERFANKEDNSLKNKAISELINIEKNKVFTKLGENIEDEITIEPIKEEPIKEETIIEKPIEMPSTISSEINNEMINEEIVLDNNNEEEEEVKTEEETGFEETINNNIKEEFAKEMDKVDDTFKIKPFDTINDDKNVNLDEVDDEVKDKLKELNDSINTHSVNKIDTNNSLDEEFNNTITNKNLSGNVGKDNLIKTVELLKFTKDKLIDIYTNEETQMYINKAKLKVIDVAEKGLDALKIILDRKDK